MFGIGMLPNPTGLAGSIRDVTFPFRFGIGKGKTLLNNARVGVNDKGLSIALIALLCILRCGLSWHCRPVAFA